MKAKELAKKSKSELEGMLDKERDLLVQFRFNVSSGKVKNVKEARTVRKNIARLLTFIKQAK